MKQLLSFYHKTYTRQKSFLCPPVLFSAGVTMEAESAVQARLVFRAVPALHVPPELLMAAFRLIDFLCANETHYQLINMSPECRCDIWSARSHGSLSARGRSVLALERYTWPALQDVALDGYGCQGSWAWSGKAWRSVESDFNIFQDQLTAGKKACKGRKYLFKYFILHVMV